MHTSGSASNLSAHIDSNQRDSAYFCILALRWVDSIYSAPPFTGLIEAAALHKG